MPNGYDVYGITVNITEVPWVRKFLLSHKPNNPSATYVLGGPYVSTARDIKIDNYDVIIKGEGEKTFAEALDSGIFIHNEHLGDNTNYPINSIPFPARRLCNVGRYAYYLTRDMGGYVGDGSHIPERGRRSTSLVTTRGCPFRCAFCSRTPWDTKARFRSVRNITEEIEEIISLGFTGLMIYDDTFTIRKDRVRNFCRAVEPYDLLWKCFIRADCVDRSLAFAMSRAGCVEVSIGVESGSQRILDTVGKKTTVMQNTTAVNICKDAGIAVRAFMILGLPGETHETVAETRKWLEEARPTSIGLGPLVPYPGSDIYENPQNYDIRIALPDDEEEWHYRGEPGRYNVYVSTSGLTSDEIAQYIYEIERDWGIVGE